MRFTIGIAVGIALVYLGVTDKVLMGLKSITKL